MAQPGPNGRSGRNRKGDHETRKPWFTLRANEAERAEIQRRADAQRQPAGVYVRQVAYRGWTRNTEAIDTVVRSTAIIEAQLQHLDSTSRDANPSPMDAIREAIGELRRLIPRL